MVSYLTVLGVIPREPVLFLQKILLRSQVVNLLFISTAIMKIHGSEKQLMNYLKLLIAMADLWAQCGDYCLSLMQCTRGMISHGSVNGEWCKISSLG